MYLVQIKKIIRKTKRSGYVVMHGKSTKVLGITIVNTTGSDLLVDKHTTKPRKKK